MAKMAAREEQVSLNDFGLNVGQALGEGLTSGLRSALSDVSHTFRPLVDEILLLLRQEALAAQAAMSQFSLAPEEVTTEADEQLAALARAEAAARACEEPGCSDPALARNLCRRHYSRRLYQERKDRLGAQGFRVVQTRTHPVFGGNSVADKKPVIVAPIIRRKNHAPAAAAAAPAPQPVVPAYKPPIAVPEVDGPIAAAAAASGVTVEGIARFFGLAKE